MNPRGRYRYRGTENLNWNGDAKVRTGSKGGAVELRPWNWGTDNQHFQHSKARPQEAGKRPFVRGEVVVNARKGLS